ncbi:hypothetical protein CTI12_AA126200 [Artemisia annua]|uniref:DUF4005 domain-containing protein n=1 Tax=Artemisia annua TaxID=35608 RepID=A0A2U1PPM8_ARTAN|nr:hypothetical protein CTI12_AA126200 [Artemisia annua]
MGKSPGKWIKTVLFGKKSSKSNLSKDATIVKKTSVTAKAASKDFDNDSMVISSPVPPVLHQAGGERTELEKTPSDNLTSDTIEVVRTAMGLNTPNEDEAIRLEQAATIAQAAFRGYMARRAFLALKGIIRLQAQVRGHLVRRQAVVTLSCMRAIVEFQALARGRRVRLSGDGCHVLRKHTPGELVDKKRADLLETSLRSEKLSKSAFGTKLVASSHTTMPLNIQYDPVEPNSVRKWLERWSSSRFWEPLPQPKKKPDAKPKRKQTKLKPEETESVRPKRSVRRVPAANLETNHSNSSENDKLKLTSRRVSSHQAESVQEQSHNELEKVKRSLRKISVSTSVAAEKSEIATEKSPVSLGKASSSPNPDASEHSTVQLFEKVNDLDEVISKQPEPEPEPEPVQPVPVPPLEEDKSLDVSQNDHDSVELPSVATDAKVDTESPMNVEINGKEHYSSKENQKTRRRKSFPAKQELPESVLQNTPTLPSYMAATESAKAKLRAQAAARAAEDGAENGFMRRHSLPSSTGKLSLQSPRAHRPLQASVKGWTKSKISARDDKMLQTGWKR